MKKVLLVLGITLGLVLGAVPARADHQGAYLDSIVHCVEGSITGACGTGFKGIEAKVTVFDPILGQWDGHSVTSLYLVGPNSSVCYGASNCDFIEFGWDQTRGLTYNDKQMFVLHVVDGVKVFEWEAAAPANGSWYFRIFEYSDGTFRFSYRKNYGDAQTWVCCAVNPSQYSAGKVFTSVETYNQYWQIDEASPVHADVHVQKADLTWKQADSSHGSPVVFIQDQLRCYIRVVISGDGSSQGDMVNYVYQPDVSQCSA